MEGHQEGKGCGFASSLWTRTPRMEQKGWGLETQASARELKGRWQQDGGQCDSP